MIIKNIPDVMQEFINDSNSLIINNRSNKEIGINNSEVDKIIENII